MPRDTVQYEIRGMEETISIDPEFLPWPTGTHSRSVFIGRMTSCGRTEGRSLWREMIGLFLYSAAGGTIVAPPDLVRNVDTAFDTPQGVPDSRVGFQYAALCLGSEDGTNSGGVQGSMRHLSAAAKLLQENPSARLLIEGHVGMGAPDEVAQSFSEYRAHVVATWLVEHFAVEEERLLMRGWGKRIAEQAQDSHHPNAAAAKQGYGWAELFIILGSGWVGTAASLIFQHDPITIMRAQPLHPRPRRHHALTPLLI